MTDLVDELITWSHCSNNGHLMRQAAERIQELEAPYRMTSEPPTEPGGYWFKESKEEDWRLVHVKENWGFLYLDGWPIENYENAKWTGPIPAPMEGKE